jgi:hypothetical protein
MILDDLKNELLAARTSIQPQIEGLHDYARLNLQPDTLAVVQTATADYERRLTKINQVLAALDDLDADGYPALDTRSVGAAVYADLQDNAKTIEAALAKFAPLNEAQTATITAGVPREQP